MTHCRQLLPCDDGKIQSAFKPRLEIRMGIFAAGGGLFLSSQLVIKNVFSDIPLLCSNAITGPLTAQSSSLLNNIQIVFGELCFPETIYYIFKRSD